MVYIISGTYENKHNLTILKFGYLNSWSKKLQKLRVGTTFPWNSLKFEMVFSCNGSSFPTVFFSSHNEKKNSSTKYNETRRLLVEASFFPMSIQIIAVLAKTVKLFWHLSFIFPQATSFSHFVFNVFYWLFNVNKTIKNYH